MTNKRISSRRLQVFNDPLPLTFARSKLMMTKSRYPELKHAKAITVPKTELECHHIVTDGQTCRYLARDTTNSIYLRRSKDGAFTV